MQTEAEMLAAIAKCETIEQLNRVYSYIPFRLLDDFDALPGQSRMTTAVAEAMYAKRDALLCKIANQPLDNSPIVGDVLTLSFDDDDDNDDIKVF